MVKPSLDLAQIVRNLATERDGGVYVRSALETLYPCSLAVGIRVAFRRGSGSGGPHRFGSSRLFRASLC